MTVLVCGVRARVPGGLGPHFALGGLLRADALSVTMLIVIGVVGTLATWASIGYVAAELAHGHTDATGARLYGVLTPAFLAAMVACGVRQQHRRDLGRDRGHHRRHRVPGRASPHPHRAGGDVEVRHHLLGRDRDGLPGHRAAVLTPPATPVHPRRTP